MRRLRIGTIAAVSALLVSSLTGCEWAIDRAMQQEVAPGRAVADPALKAIARSQSQARCDAGSTTPTPDPEDVYEPGAVELVDREPFDTGLVGYEANRAATQILWERMSERPEMDDDSWERFGVGEATCDDGHLYMTIVLVFPEEVEEPGEWAPEIVRITEGNQTSYLSSISTDGSVLLLGSRATDLITGGNVADLFLYDTADGTLEATGIEPSASIAGFSNSALAGDGDSLLYLDEAFDEDSGLFGGLFLWDRPTGNSTRLRSAGTFSDPSISDDGSAFGVKEGGSTGDIALGDVAGGYRSWLNTGPGAYQVSLSADGRYAASLGAGVFTIDRSTNTTHDVAADCWVPDPPYSQPSGSALSADGRYLVFHCNDMSTSAGSEADLTIWDRTTDTSIKVTPDADGRWVRGFPSMSDDGRFVAYAYGKPDGTGPQGTFLWDRTTGESTLIAPVVSTVVVSGDGSTIAFAAVAPDQTNPSIVDLFLWDNPAA